MSEMSDVILRVKGITKVFAGDTSWWKRLVSQKKPAVLRAVDDVSFEVRRGETLAIVGESGCGKSTLAKVIAGLHQPSRGEVELFGVPLGAANGKERSLIRSRLNMIFQDPYSSLNARWSVFDIVAEPLRIQQPGLTRTQLEERVNRALQFVQLPLEAKTKYPHQFSGGQRQRISIARALVSDPEFLICDEPTSALDVSVQAQVLNLMKEIQQHTAISYLFISHNLAVVHHMSDRVGVMYLGRLVELAPKEALFKQAKHPYTQMLLAAIPKLHPDKHATKVASIGEVPSPLAPPSGCTFHPRCPHATERCQRDVPAFELMADGHWVACHHAEKAV